jgi:hypothetical protein
MLLKILSECEQFICVDADICDNSFKILDYLNLQYHYVINKYLHNKERNIKCYEFEDYDDFVDKLKKEKKFMVCMDSKRECKKLYECLRDQTIKLYTSDDLDKIVLDDYDKIIFSPKVVYGLDSSTERPVYCLHRGNTITPKQMIQQICRCRNITEINYIFINKRVHDEKYNSFNDALEQLQNDNSKKDIFTEFNAIKQPEQTKLYLEMLAYIEYNNDAYMTNKFLHFKELLIERGLIDGNIFRKSNFKISNKLTKEVKEREMKEFDVDKLCHKKTNELLQVPKNEANEFKEYFIDKNKLRKHFNICNFFFKDTELLKEINACRDDFFINLIKTDKRKIVFNVSCKLDDNNAEKFLEQYKVIFRDRSNKEIDFTDIDTVNMYINKIMGNLFGRELIEVERIQINKKRYCKYKIKKDILLKEKELYEFRNIKNKFKDYAFESDNELDII